MKWIREEDWEGLMAFLPCATPSAWVDAARVNEETLLLNHCYLEQCAARTAMTLMFRCPDRPELLAKMSKLAREELHHFDQVHKILHERGYRYRILRPSRYAGRLNGAIRKEQPEQLIDTLIVGAYIEARSCERFAALVPHLEEVLATFYGSLLRSEARHFRDYLTLAEAYSSGPIEDRIEFFGEIEREAIESPDPDFRFHSGVPESKVEWP